MVVLVVVVVVKVNDVVCVLIGHEILYVFDVSDNIENVILIGRVSSVLHNSVDEM